MTAINSTMFL